MALPQTESQAVTTKWKILRSLTSPLLASCQPSGKISKMGVPNSIAVPNNIFCFWHPFLLAGRIRIHVSNSDPQPERLPPAHHAPTPVFGNDLNAVTEDAKFFPQPLSKLPPISLRIG